MFGQIDLVLLLCTFSLVTCGNADKSDYFRYRHMEDMKVIPGRCLSDDNMLITYLGYNNDCVISKDF